MEKELSLRVTFVKGLGLTCSGEAKVLWVVIVGAVRMVPRQLDGVKSINVEVKGSASWGCALTSER